MLHDSTTREYINRYMNMYSLNIYYQFIINNISYLTWLLAYVTIVNNVTYYKYNLQITII